MSEWQPISTAPKDVQILLYRDKQVSIGRWNDDKYNRKPRPFWDDNLSTVFGITYARSIPPTHWMPSPEPPENNATTGESK
jgi:hypothetical protein